MSRWLDDEIIASRAANEPNAAPFRLRFRGSVALLFGEGTPQSGTIRVSVDGQSREFDMGIPARPAGGNVRWVEVVAQGLDPDVEHLLVLEPRLEAEQEIRLESVCVAGGEAWVKRAS